ncbi:MULTISPECIES: UbiA family prenyltransferase [unclassified Nocardia]|uniref:UbiA family prenyltransferase n=1 Tax=unclassified Nocardia TaxID=2637762 RepID=UPI0024A84AC6|nr:MULTISPECIES: UbiA family prenyltransferase [unclassified Nocardia]
MCWSFTWGDLTATVVPATIFVLAASGNAGLPAGRIPAIMLGCCVYFWLYIYTFNLSNQLTGINEDRVNKPHRPLVRGLITPDGARCRLVVVTGVFLVVGVVLGVAEWTVLWIAAWVFHNHLRGAMTWWGKNTAMVAGTVAQLGAAWQIVTPLSAAAWTWILAIAVPLGVLVSLQDLRDLEGDLAAGRRTAVVVFGEQRLRVLLGASFAIYPFVLYVLLYAHAPTTATLLGGVAALVSFTISVRVLRCRDRSSDNTTYMLYTYWYCLTLASAVPALAR